MTVTEHLIATAKKINLVQYCELQNASAAANSLPLPYPMPQKPTRNRKYHCEHYKISGYGGLFVSGNWFSLMSEINPKTGKILTGNPIDFLMKFESLSFKEAVLKLNQLPYEQHHSSPKSSPPLEKPILSLPPSDLNSKRTFAYLVKTRGLDAEIVKKELNSMAIYQSKGHVVFCGTDTNGIVRWAQKRTTTPTVKQIFNIPGSDSNYGYALRGTSGYVFVCESPIECLSIASFEKIKGTDPYQHTKLSLGGVHPTALWQWLKMYETECVLLALNNDEAGLKGMKTIEEGLLERGIRWLRTSLPDDVKDFNDFLKLERKRQ